MPNQSSIPSSPAILGLGMQNLARANLVIAEGPYRAGDVMKWYGDYWLRVLRAEIRMHQPQFTELLCRILRRAFCEELYWRQLQLVWFWERRRVRVEYLCAQSLVHLQTTFPHKGSSNQAPFIKNLLTLIREPRCSPRHNASCHDFGLQPDSPCNMN